MSSYGLELLSDGDRDTGMYLAGQIHVEQLLFAVADRHR